MNVACSCCFLFPLRPLLILAFTSHTPRQTLVLHLHSSNESSFAVGLHLLVVLVSALPAVLPVGSAAETSL
ncbi:hypothetical protein F5888DRAFT_1689205, partial [Russula emetica]